MIELDNNATTRPSPAAIAAARRACEELWHNPSSVHRPGQAARAAVELARARLAELLGCKPRELTFTGSGTEALDLAIRGTLEAFPPPRAGGPTSADDARPLPTLITTKVEHAAVRDLAEELDRTGQARVVWLPLDGAGVVDVPAARAIIAGARAQGSPALVAVQWANNETGAIQPIDGLGAACHDARVPLLVDGVQWVGKQPTDLASLSGVDMLACSPHKFHGIKGLGVLWVRPGVRLRPRIMGTQELGRRGGTENVPAILAAGAAAEEAMAFLADPALAQAQGALRDLFEREVLSGVRPSLPGVQVNGPTAPGTRLWNTTNIAFPNLEAEALLLLMSEQGLCASAGAACSSGSLEPSPVLLAMGVPAPLAHGSLRFSLDRHTTRAEVLAGVEIVVRAVRTLLGRSWQG